MENEIEKEGHLEPLDILNYLDYLCNKKTVAELQAAIHKIKDVIEADRVGQMCEIFRP